MSENDVRLSQFGKIDNALNCLKTGFPFAFPYANRYPPRVTLHSLVVYELPQQDPFSPQSY